tara:strand:- start:772 stop:1284 length:513 start_codon:yes stop_codon:yes gene_type:complete
MSDYNPSEDFKNYLNECDIMSYRLVDGTYLIAEEFERDEESNIIYLAGALQLKHDDKTEKCFLRSWLDSDPDELIQIAGDKVIGLTATSFPLRMHYHRYFLMEKLNDVLTPNEMKDVIDQMFNPQVDNQDFMDEDEDEESWKVDNGIDNSKEFKSTSDIHLEWRRKHNQK